MKVYSKSKPISILIDEEERSRTPLFFESDSNVISYIVDTLKCEDFEVIEFSRINGDIRVEGIPIKVKVYG